MTDSERRAILAEEYRRALSNLKPNMGNRYSGAQISAAKRIARQRALLRIDAIDQAQA